LLMLSSAGRPVEAGRCKELGIARYLTKPVKQSELFDAIINALHGEPEAAAPAAAGSARTQTGLSLKILLAEDNAVNQRLATRLLEKMGHAVKVVGNGREAVAALDGDEFDMVLMDVQMPEMDGWTAATAIRAKEVPSGKRVPIIAMTAHAMKGDRELCLAAGMDDYVPKPIQARELQAAVERYSTPKTMSTSPHHLPKPPPQSVRPVGPLDHTCALQYVGGDPALLQELVGLFLKDYPRLLQGIRDAVLTSDAKKLWMNAHTLRGAIGHFGASEAAELADMLQVLGQKKELADAIKLTDVLTLELERILPTLQSWANGPLRDEVAVS